MNMRIFIFFLALVNIHFKLSMGNSMNSKCINSATEVYNGSRWNCTTGHSLLIGNYLNIGIHRSGSLGSGFTSGVPYFSLPFGVLSDFSQSGFQNRLFAGDYVFPGAPVEGITSLYHAILCNQS